MTRRAFPYLPLVFLLLALVGCVELSPPLPTTITASSPPSPTPTLDPSLTASPSPAPSATSTPVPLGTVEGFVSDISSPSLRLAGAEVSIGTNSVMTSDGTDTAVDDNGKTITLPLGEFWLPGIQPGSQTLAVLYDDASISIPVTVNPGPTNLAATPSNVTILGDDTHVPTYGPVATGSTALAANFVLHGASTTMFLVSKASGSTNLSFPSPDIDILLKAPPNGQGDSIGSYAFTYVDSSDHPLASTMGPIAITPVIVPPATYNHSSSVVTLNALDMEDSSSILFNNWTFANNFATLKIDLYDSYGQHLIARDGTPLVVNIPCQLTP